MVTGARYRSMISNFLLDELECMDVENMWFQQDGATSHTATETIELLRETFEDRIISRRGDVNWPPRSCDLTPLDFFLWGYLKEKVYANNPETIDDLKLNIIDAIQGIEVNLCKNVTENFRKRLSSCRASRVGH